MQRLAQPNRYCCGLMYVSLMATQQTVILEYGLRPVYRIEDVHESCIFPASGRHQAGHRRMLEFPGIPFLDDKVHELRILGIDVLQLSIYHLRVPSLADLHPQHTHVGMPEAVAGMFR